MEIVKIIKDESRCKACGICEKTCSMAYFKEADRNKSRIKAEKDGDAVKLFVCNQCGVCINECASEALYRDASGVVRLDKKKCVGCNICVGYCEWDAMMQHDDCREPFKCIACGLCVKKCPSGALSLSGR